MTYNCPSPVPSRSAPCFSQGCFDERPDCGDCSGDGQIPCPVEAERFCTQGCDPGFEVSPLTGFCRVVTPTMSRVVLPSVASPRQTKLSDADASWAALVTLTGNGIASFARKLPHEPIPERLRDKQHPGGLPAPRSPQNTPGGKAPNSLISMHPRPMFHGPPAASPKASETRNRGLGMGKPQRPTRGPLTCRNQSPGALPARFPPDDRGPAHPDGA